MIRYAAILVLTFSLCTPLFASTDDNKRFDWAGLSLRMHLGSALSLTRAIKPLQPINMNHEPFVELGGEYAFVLAEQFYLSGGLSWLITYPRNFTAARGFFEPPVSLWWVPLTYVQAGYIFSNDIVLSLGMVYLWAVDIQAKFPVAENWFFETKAILWIDRFFDPSAYPFYGYDSLHMSVGVGYKF